MRLTDVALGWPPAATPPVLVGASGPKSLALAGAAADGTILTAGTSPSRLRWARDRIETGREEAGRTDPHRVVQYVLASTGPRARERASAELRDGDEAELVVFGDAEAIAAGIRRWIAAGADTVVLQPLADEPDVEGLIRVAGEQIAPLLRKSE